MAGQPAFGGMVSVVVMVKIQVVTRLALSTAVAFTVHTPRGNEGTPFTMLVTS